VERKKKTDRIVGIVEAPKYQSYLLHQQKKQQVVMVWFLCISKVILAIKF
jgi:hypothetical protein